MVCTDMRDVPASVMVTASHAVLMEKILIYVTAWSIQTD